MGLLDGDLARAFGSIMGSFYLDASLHRSVITHDGGGGGSEGWAAPEACKAQLDALVDRLTDAGTYEQFQSILVLQQYAGEVIADPHQDDEISVAGGRYAIALIEQDPAGAYWRLMCRTADIVST